MASTAFCAICKILHRGESRVICWIYQNHTLWERKETREIKSCTFCVGRKVNRLSVEGKKCSRAARKKKKTLMKVMDGDDKETGSYEETKRDTSNRLELAVASPSPESKQIKRPLQITHSIWHRMGNGKWQPAPYRGLCGVCARVWVCDCARNKEARVWTRLPASFFSTGPTVSTLRWFFPFSVQSDSHERDFRSLRCYI